MADTRLFSDYGKNKKRRVIDVIETKKNEERKRDLNLYDKDMSAVLTCMEYDEAFDKKAVNADLRNRMIQLIDTVYNKFDGAIKKKDDITQKRFDSLSAFIQKIKSEEYKGNLLQAYEIICVQLTAIQSLALGQKPVSNVFRVPVKEFLELPLDDLNTAISQLRKKITFWGIGETNLEKHMPIYSSKATLGINTALFCIFNGYYPFGVGENPFPVHVGQFAEHHFAALQHDYAHASRAAKLKNDPQFAQYKTIYDQLFSDKKMKKIDDVTFKKDLLFLFFLVFDSPYSPNKEKKSIYEMIEEIAPSLKDIKENEDKKGLLEKTSLSQEEINELNQSLLLVNDYVKPLQELGYSIPHHPPRLWESADALRASLLDIAKGFASRHPEISLSPPPPAPGSSPGNVQT